MQASFNQNGATKPFNAGTSPVGASSDSSTEAEGSSELDITVGDVAIQALQAGTTAMPLPSAGQPYGMLFAINMGLPPFDMEATGFTGAAAPGAASRTE